MGKVALLGLGIMGRGMAGQLLSRGFDLTVWNRDRGKAAALAEAGVPVAETPSDAVRDADVVIAMLADDAASHWVWIESGALAAMQPGAIAIESSTLTVDWSRELASRAAKLGVGFLDAPVTGSKAQAQSGSLRFLVGGKADVLERARPVMSALGSVVHIGSQGSGTLLKLINNYLCGVQAASLAEALAMVERSGISRARAMEVLLNGAPASPVVKLLSERMLQRAYEPQFFVALMAKDLAYASRALSAAGIDSNLAVAAGERYTAAERAGFGHDDMAAVIEPIRK
jgi:3-hydroxyisobutyrate dehydrogenase